MSFDLQIVNYKNRSFKPFPIPYLGGSSISAPSTGQ